VVFVSAHKVVHLDSFEVVLAAIRVVVVMGNLVLVVPLEFFVNLVQSLEMSVAQKKVFFEILFFP